MDSAWVEFRQSDLNEPRREKIRDQMVTVMNSPFDVPVAGRVKRSRDCIDIEFRYVGKRRNDESVLELGPGISVEIGDRGRRVYSIRVDAKQVLGDGDNELATDQTLQAIRDFLEGYLRDHSSGETRTLRPIEKAIDKYARELVPTV